LLGRQQWPIGGALLAASSLGRLEAARKLERRLDDLETCVRFNHVVLDDARAWALAARGELERARDLLDRAADEGIAERSRTCASIALHSLARLGAPERALERSRQVAEAGQGELIPARTAHVEALVTHDAAALADAAATFERLGLMLVAAEAEADAARAYRKSGRSREASAAAQRSRALVKQCEGALTPALALADEATPLTRREREVALLASQGLASKDIAEKLFLSVRTVENHLQRAYEKLGVSGREALAAILGSSE
jgi:DNA-binding CsgD family transcriptional regulator